MGILDLIKFGIDFILHMDRYLAQIITATGAWTYGILFVIIFIETGLVVTPFLPGDSLLFMAGALASSTKVLDPILLFILMAGAAILGDTANYWIGHTVGERAFSGNVRWLKKEYLDRTVAFYNKHGGKTIFLARFVPIVRTFAPFVAGVGKMRYSYFISYNIFGGIVWTALFIFGGYFFGNLKFVQDNFSLVTIAIILISVVPAVVEVIKERKLAKAQADKIANPTE
jgi:membrane-associated protein